MIPLEIRVDPPPAAIKSLLDAAGLPSSDIDEVPIKRFLAGYVGGEPAGIVGLEPYAADGLLRSLAIVSPSRGAGYGRTLVAEAEAYAAGMGIRRLYLLTTTAEAYFHRLGYRRCDRAAAPAAIRRSREFSALCPDDAVFMCKRL